MGQIEDSISPKKYIRYAHLSCDNVYLLDNQQLKDHRCTTSWPTQFNFSGEFINQAEYFLTNYQIFPTPSGMFNILKTFGNYIFIGNWQNSAENEENQRISLIISDFVTITLLVYSAISPSPKNKYIVWWQSEKYNMQDSICICMAVEVTQQYLGVLSG